MCRTWFLASLTRYFFTALCIRSARLRLRLARLLHYISARLAFGCASPGHCAQPLAAPHWMDDLDLVAVREEGLGVAGALGDLAVQGHRGELPADLQRGEQAL